MGLRRRLGSGTLSGMHQPLCYARQDIVNSQTRPRAAAELFEDPRPIPAQLPVALLHPPTRSPLRFIIDTQYLIPLQLPSACTPLSPANTTVRAASPPLLRLGSLARSPPSLVPSSTPTSSALCSYTPWLPNSTWQPLAAPTRRASSQT